MSSMSLASNEGHAMPNRLETEVLKSFTPQIEEGKCYSPLPYYFRQTLYKFVQPNAFRKADEINVVAPSILLYTRAQK
jgi:hypothetical protein